MESHRQYLSSSWNFKQSNAPDSSFLPCSQFPTCIHLDLLHHGLIPDPLLDDNETRVQWVGEEAWTYQIKFTSPYIHSITGGNSAQAKVELVFEGLDTFATVFLNGEELLKTENMYVAYRLDVGDKLRQGKHANELELNFDSAFLVGKKLEQETGGLPLFCHNGDSSRLQVRKAPYSYGWDWGPTMLTCGPWRPVYLETFVTRISDFSFDIDLTEDLSSATIQTAVKIEGVAAAFVKFQLFKPDGKQLQEQTSDSLQAASLVSAPQLWFPAGNGEQPLYSVTATVLNEKGLITSITSKRLGLRRVELIQRPLNNAPGTTFFFQINNVPIFCHGANWVPADMFLPRTTAETYRKWVQLMVDGNQNMIRVWGGGVYEENVFYDYCDELGVMVWQDFMLGCGSYPATPKFLVQIEEEAIYNVKLLRSHPSVVLWCGNNEDHMFADRYTTQYDPDDKDPKSWLKTNWPARIIYDKLLPEICGKYVPRTPYHPGSPWGGRPSNDPTVGDVHAWDVWMKASAQYPYQWYPKISGRFVSEFGLKAYPTLKTIKEFITKPEDRYPQSRMMDAHMKSSSKSPWGRDFRTIALYLTENVKHGFALEHYTYASQLIQAEAMTYAYSGWRRLWKGHGDEQCAGILVWQLNDAWPSVSWSLADSNMRRKYAYWSVKRATAPISLGIARADVEISRASDFTNVHVEVEKRIQVWGSNLTGKAEEYHLDVRGIDVTTGEQNWQRRKVVVLSANRAVEFMEEPLPDKADTAIFCGRLIRKEVVIARFFDWPQPLRYLDLPRPDVKVRVDGERIYVSSNLPVKGLAFDVDDDAVVFDDNCIDVVPGDEQIIQAHGLRSHEISFIHLALAV